MPPAGAGPGGSATPAGIDTGRDLVMPLQQLRSLRPISPAAVCASVFKPYDIRGIAGDTLTPDSIYSLGRAIGSEAAARGIGTLAVGRDARLSSPEFAAVLIHALCDSGCEVLDAGRVPTPLLYFAAHHYAAGSGVMLTASHNPAQYNGLKIVLGGEVLHGEGIQVLRRRIERNDLVEGMGSVLRIAVADTYLQSICSDIRLERPLKVVVDAGNGMAGELAPRLFRQLGCEVHELYCDIDGHFPNHHPDPTELDNLQDLIAAVGEQGADLGFAFDGDSDRIGVVDSAGKVIWPDRLLMLLAIDVLARNPDATILFDIKCTSNLYRVIEQHGGRPLMWRTGHSVVRSKMHQVGALLAGELTGHLFFADRWFGADDALYAGARLLELLARSTDSSAVQFSALPDAVNTQEFKIPVPGESHHQLMERLLARAEFPDARLITLDGLRLEFPFGWALLRASNTTPSLGVRFEAGNQQELELIQQRIRKLINSEAPRLTLPF